MAVNDMTLEERVAFLEQKLARMDSKPENPLNVYKQARNACEDYFEQNKMEGQNFGAFTMCSAAVRDAFKEKHLLTQGRKNLGPATYIRTQQDAEEYVSLFKSFLDVWQSYLKQ